MMTVKEWAAAYRRINEWEQRERLARLPRESVEDSVRSYFALCQMVLGLSREADENPGLWELRLRHYQALTDRWRRLVQALSHAS